MCDPVARITGAKIERTKRDKRLSESDDTLSAFRLSYNTDSHRR